MQPFARIRCYYRYGYGMSPGYYLTVRIVDVDTMSIGADTTVTGYLNAIPCQPHANTLPEQQTSVV